MKRKLVKVAVAPLLVAAITFTVPEMLPVQDNISVVEAASVKISAKKLTLIKGQSKTLKISGTKSKVTWSSSKKSVATVNSKGKVTAKRAGTATITAKVGKKKYTCKVTVEAPKLNKTSLSLKVKKTYKLKISGTKQKVKWSVGNKSVATVNSSGIVTAKKTGSTRVIATVGGKKYTCVVKVSKGTVAVTKVKLNKSSLNLDEGKTYRLKASVSPSNATNKTVKWTSSKKSVATVDSKGNVKAVAPGKATITAKSGSKSAKCTVTVEAVGEVPVCENEHVVYTAKQYFAEDVIGSSDPAVTMIESSQYLYIANLEDDAKIIDITSSNPYAGAYKMTSMDALYLSRSNKQEYYLNDLTGITTTISFKVVQNGKTYPLTCKVSYEIMKSPFSCFKIGNFDATELTKEHNSINGPQCKGEQKVVIQMAPGVELDQIYVSKFNYTGTGVTMESKVISNNTVVDFDEWHQIEVIYHFTNKPANYVEPKREYGSTDLSGIKKITSPLQNRFSYAPIRVTEPVVTYN